MGVEGVDQPRERLRPSLGCMERCLGGRGGELQDLLWGLTVGPFTTEAQPFCAKDKTGLSRAPQADGTLRPQSLMSRACSHEGEREGALKQSPHPFFWPPLETGPQDLPVPLPCLVSSVKQGSGSAPDLLTLF